MSDSIILTDVDFFKTDFTQNSVEVPPRPFSSLTYRISGRVSISSSGESFISSPGTVTIVPQGCGYRSVVTVPGEMLVLHFRTLDAHSPIFKVPMCLSPQFSGVFTTLFERALRHSDASDQLACMADAYRLLAEAAALVSAERNTTSPKLSACKEYIESRICDPELRVSDIADFFGSSEVYLRRKFKDQYGTSPLDYIKKRRIDVACQLLDTGLYSVTEVAVRSGFDSISYFSSEFHRMIGCSPKNYVK